MKEGAIKNLDKMHVSKTNISMNTTHYITEMQTKTDENNGTFLRVDSAAMELFPLMSPVGTDDAAMLYIQKGEVTLVYDMKTYILSKGMLLYKVPNVAIQLLSFSEDCRFFALPLKLKLPVAG